MRAFPFYVACDTNLLKAVILLVDGQQPKRIGILASQSQSAARREQVAFRQSLRDLGCIEGQNLIVEYREAAGKPG